MANDATARIDALEVNVARLEGLLISTRSLLQDTLMTQAGRSAATTACRRYEFDADCPEMTPEREAAIKSLAGGIDIKHLKYINANCIVGKTTCRNRYGVKVTRRELTLSKYQCPPSEVMGVDRETAELLFG